MIRNRSGRRLAAARLRPFAATLLVATLSAAPLAVATLGVTLLAPTPAAADDAEAMRARIVELEKQQKKMMEEMRALKEQLEASAAAAPAAATPAAVTADAGDTRVEEVERKQGIMTEELRKVKEALVLPETKELKSQYGLGPAASKVYGVKSGVSLAGYGEFNYKNVVSDRGTANDDFDMLRLVLYTGYKFNDRILFNSELEFEHATTGKSGEVSIEFASLDFFLHEKINARAGLLLVPMGFVNEIHEPPFFHGNLRPQVEQQIIPSTWRSNGAGIFGTLAPGLDYRSYVITGMNARGFSSSGIRGGRQSGSVERAEDFAWVGRLDYSPMEMLTFGGSAYLGNSGQDQSFGNSRDGFRKPDVFTQIYEGHAKLATHGFETRFLGVWMNVDDAAAISRDSTINPAILDPTKKDQPFAGSQFGWYGEVAYDVLPLVFADTTQYLAPWFRYSRIDTQDEVPFGFTADESRDRELFEVGLTYKPISQVVLKLDYRNQEPKSGNLPDEVRLGAGFVF